MAIAGGVVSRRRGRDTDAVPPWLVASHVGLAYRKSDVKVDVTQPYPVLRISLSVSLIDHCTVMSLVYQPLALSVPVTIGVITEGVVSPSPSCVIAMIVEPSLMRPWRRTGD